MLLLLLLTRSLRNDAETSPFDWGGGIKRVLLIASHLVCSDDSLSERLEADVPGESAYIICFCLCAHV